MSQEQRDLTMKKFKQKKINLLVCTDVAARGIDVTDLTHVINFSLPQDNESYVHRIGRTGRGGNKGIALSIIESSELRRISQIERITKAKIEKIKLPEVKDIVNVLMEKAIGQFETSIESFDDQEENFTSFKERFADKSYDDLLQGLYAFIFDQSLKRYKKARTIDLEPRQRAERGERDSGRRTDNGAQSGYNRYHITLGRQNGLEPGGLIKLVANNLSISGGEIGKIKIMNDFSFFELPEEHKEQVLDLSGTTWNGEKFKLQVAKPSAGGARGGSTRAPRRSGGRSSAPSTGGRSFNRGGDRDGNRDGNRADGNRSDGNRGSYSSRRSDRDGNRDDKPRARRYS